jgi:hypothetical protein
MMDRVLSMGHNNLASCEEHDMVHFVMAAGEYSELINQRGGRGARAVLDEIRSIVCPEYSAAELEAADMLSPREEVFHSKDGVVEIFQKVDVL